MLVLVVCWWGLFSFLHHSCWVCIPANSYVCSSQYGGCGEFIGDFCYNSVSLFISGNLYPCLFQEMERAHMASEITSAEVD